MAKVLTLEELADAASTLAREGKRLVLTNGCFDILHAGHVTYLAQARALGDALAVAINSDASVRALKGPSRPVNPDTDRAAVVAALAAVDFVTVFPEPRATAVIRAVQPAIYAKGGDYTPESLDPEESAALHEVGAEITILPALPGRSTTGILERASKNSAA